MTKKNKENKSGNKSRYMIKAADITIDMISATVSAAFKLVGTVLLILLVTGMEGGRAAKICWTESG